MVNLEWYRSFVAVYRVGTVSGAALMLHLTQPAVSQHLAALEAALGYLLFVRMPRKMLPTVEGKSLYTTVAASIEQLESISTRYITVDAPQIIRLGTPQEFFAERILHKLSPSEQIRYRISFGLAQDLTEQLLAGQLDIIIATQKFARSDLEYQPIAEETFWLVAPPTVIDPILLVSLQADLTTLERWLRSQPLIAYSEDLPIIRRFWRVVFGRRLDLTPQLVLPDLRMIRQSIVTGFGFSVLPDYLCTQAIEDRELMLVLKPTNAVTNQIWLAYRKSERLSQLIRLCLDLFSY
jgi:DNA-binding transcriptional LysR family regulator